MEAHVSVREGHILKSLRVLFHAENSFLEEIIIIEGFFHNVFNNQLITHHTVYSEHALMYNYAIVVVTKMTAPVLEPAVDNYDDLFNSGRDLWYNFQVPDNVKGLRGKHV